MATPKQPKTTSELAAELRAQIAAKLEPGYVLGEDEKPVIPSHLTALAKLDMLLATDEEFARLQELTRERPIEKTPPTRRRTRREGA